MRRRLLLSLTLGLVAGLYAWWFADHQARPSDFSQLWAAARGWLHGQNPYDVVGPGRSWEWGVGLLYPLPAVMLAIPFALVPLRVADALFVALGSGLLAFALTRQGWSPRLWVFASFAFLELCQVSQWSALLTAGTLMPSLGFVLIAKPQIGLALFLAYPSRRTAMGCSLFLGLSLILMPSWPAQWLAIVRADGGHTAAQFFQPAGWLLALALLRWRRPEARLLFGLSILPHTPGLSDTIPLFLTVTCLEEGMVLATCTLLVSVLRNALAPESMPAMWALNAELMTYLVYFPCLVMILQRPNEGRIWPWSTLTLRLPKHSNSGSDASTESRLTSRTLA